MYRRGIRDNCSATIALQLRVCINTTYGQCDSGSPDRTARSSRSIMYLYIGSAELRDLYCPSSPELLDLDPPGMCRPQHQHRSPGSNSQSNHSCNAHHHARLDHHNLLLAEADLCVFQDAAHHRSVVIRGVCGGPHNRLVAKRQCVAVHIAPSCNRDCPPSATRVSRMRRSGII